MIFDQSWSAGSSRRRRASRCRPSPAFVGHAGDDPARAVAFGDGALAAFGPGRYVNRAIGVSLDDIDDARLDELEAFYAASGVPPSLEVASWAPDGAGASGSAAAATCRSGSATSTSSDLDGTPCRAHPTMMVREVDAGHVRRVAGRDPRRPGFDAATPAEVVRSDEYGPCLHASPAPRRYLAEIDGEPAGCGSLTRDERHRLARRGDHAAGRFRERGVQGALVRERMAAAHGAGASSPSSTAMPAGDSARNLSRLGFTLAYCQAVMTKLRAVNLAPAPPAARRATRPT